MDVPPRVRAPAYLKVPQCVLWVICALAFVVAASGAAPSAPTIVSVVAGNAQATVNFLPSASNGGSAISYYTATAYQSGVATSLKNTANASGTAIVVTGLTNGTSYTFAVTATNSVDTGPASSDSPAAVPGDWANNFGLGGYSFKYDVVNATTTDSSGNVYITGYIEGATGATFTVGGVNLTMFSSRDAFAAKFNAAGTVVWAKNYGGSGAYAYGRGIAVDSAGNVYLGGYFQGANLTTPALAGASSATAFALKLDSSGTTTWAKSFGGGGANMTVDAIAVDSAGNVYLGGQFNTYSPTTTPALTKIGSSDAFALKLDATGATTWAKNFGGSGAYASGNGIAVDSAGNVYLGGNVDSANLTTPALTKKGIRDAFALKLSSSGATTWAKNFGGSGANVYGRGIAVDSAGNVYLGGDGSGTLTTPALTMISTDAFALKLDSSGTPTWAKNFGGSGATTYGYGIAVDSAGSVYLGGYFMASLTTPALTKIGGYDAFALKLDATGATTWAKNYGGSGAYAYGYGIAVDSAGNVYLGGCFSAASLTTPALTLKGYQDALLIKQSYPFPPGAPTGVMAAGGNGQSTVTFTAPPSNGGAVITGYTVTSIPAGGTDSNAGSTGLSHIVTGLANGTSYTFTVTATNSGGTGSASSASPAAVIGDWAKNYGLSGSNAYVTATATDSLGNVYIAGNFDGATLAVGGVTLARIGSQDAFAAKLNSSGVTTWAKSYGGSGASAYGIDIALDSAGNVYLGGYFSAASLTTPSLTKKGTTDAFALKLNSSGVTTWAKNYGGSGANVYGGGIAVDSAGSVYLGGFFSGASLTTPALTKIGTRDAFALKLDATGATTWAKNFGGSGADTWGTAIAVDSAGNVYLGGDFSTANLTTPALTKIGSDDTLLIKQSYPFSPGAPTGVTAAGGSAGGGARFFRLFKGGS